MGDTKTETGLVGSRKMKQEAERKSAEVDVLKEMVSKSTSDGKKASTNAF